MSPIAEQRTAPTLDCRSAAERRAELVLARNNGRRRCSDRLLCRKHDHSHVRQEAGTNKLAPCIVPSLSAQLQAHVNRARLRTASDARDNSLVTCPGNVHDDGKAEHRRWAHCHPSQHRVQLCRHRPQLSFCSHIDNNTPAACGMRRQYSYSPQKILCSCRLIATKASGGRGASSSDMQWKRDARERQGKRGKELGLWCEPQHLCAFLLVDPLHIGGRRGNGRHHFG